MTHRMEKVQSTMTRALQEVIARGLHDPRAGGLITVTGVDISPDLQNAIVHVSILPAEKSSLTMHALNSAARHIRREVGDKMSLKKMPDLAFRLDDSLKKQAEVFAAINKAREDGKADAQSDKPGQSAWNSKPVTPKAPDADDDAESGS